MKYVAVNYLKIVIAVFTIYLAGQVGQAQTLGALHTYQNDSSELYVEKGSDLKQALGLMEQRFNMVFLYRSDAIEDVEIGRTLHLSQTMNIERVLRILLAGTDLEYKSLNPKTYGIYKKEEVFKESDFMETYQETVTGRVIDAQTGEALPGVNVIVERSEEISGSTIGTTTDIDGNYEIQVPEGLNIIAFTYIGYQRLVVAIDGRSEINVELDSDIQQLEDVIVVAFGAINREEFVGSATQLTSRDFETRAITNASQIIAGASPGVQVTSGGGQPGSGLNVRIRGFGSINASSAPLYVVDGAIFTGDLASINPHDIETFTILKDAASTSLYGSGAGNGVVMITTKQGRRGPGTFSVNMSQGFTTRAIPAYDRVSAQDYYPLIWEAYRNSLNISGSMSTEEANEVATATVFSLLGMNPFNVPNDQIVGTDGQLNPNATLLYEDDWWDEIARTGIRSKMDFSYSGGSDETTYFASFGYHNETGYAISSNFERFNARLNVDSRLTDWFKAGINLQGANSEGNHQVDRHDSGLAANPFRGAMLMGPIYPIYNRDFETGEIIEVDGLIYDRGASRPVNTGRNFIAENLLDRDIRKNTSLNSRVFGEINFLDNLIFKAQVAFDRRMNAIERSRNTLIGDASPAGDASRTSIITTGVTFFQTLDYNTQLRLHSIGVTAGHESFQYDFEHHLASRTEEVRSGNPHLINYVNVNNANSFVREYRKEGYFARINYDYDNKYYLSTSIRRDASSRFHESVRWNNFWSVGASWRLSQESFMQGIDWLNSLKLSTSFGETGNDSHLSHGALSFYAYQHLYNLNFNNQNEAGILLDTEAPGNPNLKWETSRQTNIALDFELFDNRLNGTIEWYNRVTSDLLFDVPLPLSSGVESFPDNVGSMYNRGFEFSLGVDLIRSGNFQWNILTNASTLKNRITSMPQDEIISGTKKLMVGHSINDFWLRQWYGVDPIDGAALYIAEQSAIDASGSDIREVDGIMVTTDPNNAEFAYVGTAIPDLFGSITNTLVYKGLSLRTLVSYQIGGKTYDNSYYGQLMHPGSGYGFALHSDILNRWQEPGDITDVPRLDSSQGSNFGAANSSRWLFDADYLILQNVTLSYEIPVSIISRFGVSRASVYASGENLLHLTALKGLEAGQQFSGTTTRRYAPARIITFGANLTF
jgi:TonB-dependent starch-binding outer membrane protein SusC